MSNRRKANSRGGGVSPLKRLAIAVSSGLSVFVVVAIVALAGAVWMYQGPGPAAKAGADFTTVELRHGASLPEIASTLKRAGVIRSSSVFVTAAQLTGAARRLKAGEYSFASGQSIAQILADVYIALTSGQEEIGFGQPEAEKASAAGTMQAFDASVLLPRPQVVATASELEAHEARLAKLRKKAGHAWWDGERAPEPEPA